MGSGRVGDFFAFLDGISEFGDHELLRSLSIVIAPSLTGRPNRKIHMKTHFALSDLSRPYADNDHSILDQPHTIFRTPKIPGKASWTPADNRMLLDPGLPGQYIGLLVILLSHRSDFEFERLVDITMGRYNVSKNTAYTYINDLVELGYIHKVAHHSRDHRPVKRYKVTELPLRPREDSAKFMWVGGMQTSKARATGAFQNFRVVGYEPAALSSPLTAEEMLAERKELHARMAGERREQAIENYRAARADDFFAPVKRLPKFWDPNKRRIRSSSLRSEEEESQTLSPKGPRAHFLNPERSLPSAKSFESSETGRPLAGAARAQRRNTRRQALQRKRSAAGQRAERKPRQSPSDFDLLPVTARTSPGDAALRAFANDYANLADGAMRELVAPKTEGWRARFVANPYMGMLQRVLGIPVWTAVELRFWSGRLRRGSLRFDEVLLLWSALIAGKEAMHPQLHREVLVRLTWKHFRDISAPLPADVSCAEGRPRDWNWIMQALRTGLTQWASMAGSPEKFRELVPALSELPRSVFSEVLRTQGLDYMTDGTEADYDILRALEGSLSEADAHLHQRMLLTTETSMYLMLPEICRAENLDFDPGEFGVTDLLESLAPPAEPTETVTRTNPDSYWDISNMFNF